jgi:hypothetical protein
MVMYIISECIVILKFSKIFYFLYLKVKLNICTLLIHHPYYLVNNESISSSISLKLTIEELYIIPYI